MTAKEIIEAVERGETVTIHRKYAQLFMDECVRLNDRVSLIFDFQGQQVEISNAERTVE